MAQKISQVLEDAIGDCKVPVLEEKWPNVGKLSLKAALILLKQDEQIHRLESLITGLKALENMAPAPIIAVMGSMNGGKSSCVASLLSAENAERVLRGIRNHEATNRFVFWLPKSWDDRNGSQDIWNSVESQLTSVFGNQMEFLSEEPDKAKEQYGVASRIEIPLVAFDEQLDALNICLLDCPDVESSTDGNPLKERLAMVEKSVKLIHGVLYLVDTQDMRADRLQGLANILNEQLAERPKYLLINKMRKKDSEVEARISDEDVQGMERVLGATGIFAAYDFDVIGSEDVLPHEAAKNAKIREDFPWFFKVSPEKGKNEAEGITTERMLPISLQEFDAEILWAQAIQDKKRSLHTELQHTRRIIQEICEVDRMALQKKHHDLINFLEEQMTDKTGELKIPFTAVLLKNISESLNRTAPWWAKPALLANRAAMEFQTRIRARWDEVHKIWKNVGNPQQAGYEQVEKVKGKFQNRRGKEFFQPDDFMKHAKIYGIDFGDVSDSELEAAWKQALQKIESKNDLSDQDLDRETQQIWKGIPVWKRVAIAAAAPVILLLGLMTACLALVDLGVSAVILTSSTVQLLGILGIGGVAAIGGGGAMLALDDLLKKNIAIPVYCRFVAASCDTFGLPREIDKSLEIPGKNQTEDISDKEKYPEVPTKVPLVSGILAREFPDGWKKIESHIV